MKPSKRILEISLANEDCKPSLLRCCEASPEASLCLIIAPQNKGTILDRIAHEIGSGFANPIYYYGVTDIPKAERYFVTHYTMLLHILQQVNPDITPVTCFFTHDKGGLPDYVDSFNLCHSVIAESSEGLELLASLGVSKDILHFVPECGDNLAFKPHARSPEGAILVCGTNYSDGRKNPELVYEVCKLLYPRRSVFLLGKDWLLKDGSKCAEYPYSEYPKAFSECSVYLSCSKLEGGGPNSLIEAMHANLFPVVSDTGNARNYIVDGYNGFIFPLNATAKKVVELIEEAYNLKPQNVIPYNDIWQTVCGFTWKSYALQMKEIIMNDYSITASHGEFGELPKDDEPWEFTN